ncbi:Nif3-like dinuclear metal center hexameric protein [Liquorilactobacillus sicerae]|uniref:Nif3-like dinuclear metal center hexameric protein n=1 Tax=Liquorilactobacillus sicerae TaxID=1416943 RepID=UPI002480399B|nr:Nif3-like dinuclear metal center hexameric protein [Liquorilactobacillus sicerae]
MTKVKEVVERFEKFAPKEIAEPGDPVGLQLGSLSAEIKKMMVTLDVRPEVVKEAIDQQVDFIFAHHPAMFHPVKHFDLTVPQNQMYAELIKHGITVYAAHTNLDNAPGGMNDWLAAALGLTATSSLLPLKEESLDQLCVYVPRAAAATVRQALAQAGAGSIGNYTGCSYSAVGTGRFLPNQAAQPLIGQANQPSQAAEEKLEVFVRPRLVGQVIQAMLAAHPYEEPVYYLVPVHGLNQKYGMGRVGQLKHPLTVEKFALMCKQTFKISGLRVISPDLNQIISRVAVLGGSGAQFYPAALQAHADVYLTGDVTYHTGHDILAAGLTVIDPGHHIESICKPNLKRLFEKWRSENDWQFPIITSRLNTDPFKFI